MKVLIRVQLKYKVYGQRTTHLNPIYPYYIQLLRRGYNKCIRARIYTLPKRKGRDELAMSCTYSFSSLVENLKWLFIDVIGHSTYLLFVEEKYSVPVIEHSIPYHWK